MRLQMQPYLAQQLDHFIKINFFMMNCLFAHKLEMNRERDPTREVTVWARWPHMESLLPP